MAKQDARAITNHIMKMQRQMLEEAARTDISSKTGDGKMQMIETKIYVGLNDSETREQKFETDKYLGILKKVCRSYHMAFSVDIEEGGYFHEDGEYTEETSLVLVLIDADRDTVREIAKDLCVFFHQETVLITEDRIDGYFISKDALE